MKENWRNIKKNLKKAGKWPWGVIVANTLTFLTLWYSIYQNGQNEKENDDEKRRISKRDSIQTETFLNEYKAQLQESKRQRNSDSIRHKRDSMNLVLYQSQIVSLNKSLLIQNKALDYQNQNLEIQRLSNKSELNVKIKFPESELNNGKAVLNPMFLLKNTGRSVAYDVKVNYIIIRELLWNSKRTYNIIRGSTQSFEKPIYPDSTILLSSYIGYGGYETVADSAQKIIINREKNKLDDWFFNNYRKSNVVVNEKERTKMWHILLSKQDSLNAVFPDKPVSVYIACKIIYKDKYQKNSEELYTINKVEFVSSLKQARFMTHVIPVAYPVKINQLKYLRNELIKSNFNYNKIFNDVRMNNANAASNNNIRVLNF